MNYTTTIIVSNETLKEFISQKYEFELIKIENGIEILAKDDEMLLVYCDDIQKSTIYVHENYFYEKIINIGESEVFTNSELKVGDIILPNTFISTENDIPYFIDNSIGGNYDLTKFGLILNGICLTTLKNMVDLIDYEADIMDQEIYNFLEIINKNDALEHCHVIKYITEPDIKDDTESIENSLIILDIIL